MDATTWGGYAMCQHTWVDGVTVHKGGPSASGQTAATIGREAPAERNKVQSFRAGESCSACGAWRGHFGLEPLPDCLAWARAEAPCARCFICHLRVVAAALWRVLRRDGTMWLNLADCYVDGGRGEDTYGPAGGLEGGRANRAESRKATMRQDYKDLRGKNLVGIPARAALALQADGWIYRRDIIWRKPNPMPESALDRPTSAHEYIFLFAKSRFYFYDNEAVREPVTGGAHARAPKGQADPKAQHSLWNQHRREEERSPDIPAGWATGNGNHRELKGRYTSGQTQRKERAFVPGAGEPGVAGARAHVSAGVPWTDEGLGRNMRSVWDITTKPFPGAHFACVDELTEALTKSGWKRHDELVDGEEIAAYVDGTLRWQSAIVHRYPHTGPMVSVEKRGLSMRLTEDHRCLVKRRDQKPSIVSAANLAPAMEIPTSAEGRLSCSSPIGMPWAELVGWYIAEGYCVRPGRLKLYQSDSANPGKVERIRRLLHDVGAAFSERKRTREWRGRPSVEVEFSVSGEAAARLQSLAPAKAMTPRLCWLPRGEARALLFALIDGDGHFRPDGRSCIVQKDRRSLELMQAMAINQGYRAMLRPRGDVNVLYLTLGRWITLRETNGRHSPIGREQHDGVVWCPAVASGLWLARRDGKPFITGNTFPPEIPERCIMAGTSERGCCRFCGAPWARVVEKQSVPRSSSALAGNHTAAGYEHGGKNTLDASALAGLAREGHDVRDGLTPATRTIGWTPTCGHLVCRGCAIVLDSGSSTTAVPAVPRDLPTQAPGEPFLQEGLLEPVDGEAQDDEHGPGDVVEGLRADLSPGPPGCLEGGLRGGASPRDGEGDRETSAQERGSAPPGWSEEPQRSEEPGGDEEAGARSADEQGEEASGAVPKLRPRVPRASACAVCHGPLGDNATPPEPVPCTVLDPFGGAFTTALVAKNLGRHAVTIELKLEYITDHLPRLAQHVLL